MREAGVGDLAPRSDPKTERLIELDLLRGLAVLGMTFVNACIILHDVNGASVPRALLHSEWAGFTVADAVFPLFVLAVGISAAASLEPLTVQERRKRLGNACVRALRMLVLGLLVSNLDLIIGDPAAYFRPMGVLQRLAFVYFASALAMAYLSSRARLIVAVALLAAYAVLLSIHPHGQPFDLARPGLDLPAWLDRTVLGNSIYVQGPQGYDPEGILSTIPAIAQGFIGTCLFHPLRRLSRQKGVAILFAASSILVALAAIVLGQFEPISKALWTPSFVMLSTGVALAILFVLKTLRRSPPVAGLLLPLGINAIAAYVLQEVAGYALTWAPLGWGSLMGIPTAAVATIDAVAFTGILCVPAVLAWRFGLRVQI